jgi:hypothetical protein
VYRHRHVRYERLYVTTTTQHVHQDKTKQYRLQTGTHHSTLPAPFAASLISRSRLWTSIQSSRPWTASSSDVSGTTSWPSMKSRNCCKPICACKQGQHLELAMTCGGGGLEFGHLRPVAGESLQRFVTRAMVRGWPQPWVVACVY